MMPAGLIALLALGMFGRYGLVLYQVSHIMTEYSAISTTIFHLMYFSRDKAQRNLRAENSISDQVVKIV